MFKRNSISSISRPRIASGAILLACLAPLTACNQIQDLRESVFGGESDEASGSSRAGGPTTGSGAPAAADGTALPAVPAPAASASSMMAMLPANPDAALRFNVAGSLAMANTLGGTTIAAEEINAQIAVLLAETEIPAELASRILLANATELVLGVWVSEESIVVITNPEAIANPPAEGELSSFGTGVQIGQKNGRVILGVGPAFTRAWGLTAGVGSFAPETDWAAGHAIVSQDSLFSFFTADTTQLQQTVLADLAAAGLSVQRIALAIRPNGTIVAAIDTPDDAPIRRALGASQAAVAQGIAGLRTEMPPQAQGALNYGELVLRALWSQLSLTREGTLTTIATLPAQCGSSLTTSLLAMAALGAGIDLSTQFPVAAFTPSTQRVASGCNPMPGPATAFPRDMARVVDFASPGAAGALLIDYAGLLRQALPTLFGLMPVALEPADVNEAFGPNPLGLSSFDQANAWIVAGASEVGGAPNFFVSYPSSADALIPPGTLAGLPSVPTPGVGTVIAIPDGAAALARTYDPNSPVGQALGALNPASAVALVVDGDAVRQGLLLAGMQLSIDPALQTALANVEAVALGIDQVAGSRLVVRVPTGAANTATQLNQAIAAQLERAIAQAGADPQAAALTRNALQRVQQQLSFTAQGDQLVQLDLIPAGTMGGGGVSLAIVTTAILGGIGYASQAMDAGAEGDWGMDPEFGVNAIAEAAVSVHGNALPGPTGKPLPNRFPPTFGPIPTVAEISTACASGQPGAAVDYLQWATALGSFTYANAPATSRVSYEVQSAGAGPGAQFTARAVADLDCDGVFATYERFGSTQAGLFQVRNTDTNVGE
jgi:hypothetical protein